MRCFTSSCLGVAAGFLGMVFVSVEGAEVAMRAVQVNDTPIAPTDHVTINPGDSVVVEFHISGWDEDLPGGMLRTYQVTFDGVNSCWSGTSGRVIPKGIDRPGDLALCHSHADCPVEASTCRMNGIVTPDVGMCVRSCTTDSHCLGDYPICTLWGYCVGSDHDPEQYAFIDSDRSDYVHYDFLEVNAVRVVSIDYAWGSTTITLDGPFDMDDDLYMATMVVEASPDACGHFTLKTVAQAQDSFIEVQIEWPSSWFALPQSSMVVDVFCPEVAACCRFQHPCVDITEDECAALDGVFQSGKNCGDEGQTCPRFPGPPLPTRHER